MSEWQTPLEWARTNQVLVARAYRLIYDGRIECRRNGHLWEIRTGALPEPLAHCTAAARDGITLDELAAALPAAPGLAVAIGHAMKRLGYVASKCDGKTFYVKRENA